MWKSGNQERKKSDESRIGFFRSARLIPAFLSSTFKSSLFPPPDSWLLNPESSVKTKNEMWKSGNQERKKSDELRIRFFRSARLVPEFLSSTFKSSLYPPP